jgi:hypothetical protein
MSTVIKSGIIGFVLLPIAFLMMGMFGVFFPAYGPIVFLLGEVALGVYSLYRLTRGIYGIRGGSRPAQRAERDTGFGAGATVALVLMIIGVYFFSSSN